MTSQPGSKLQLQKTSNISNRPSLFLMMWLSVAGFTKLRLERLNKSFEQVCTPFDIFCLVGVLDRIFPSC